MSEDKKIEEEGVVSFPSIFDDSDSVPITHNAEFSVFGKEDVNKKENRLIKELYRKNLGDVVQNVYRGNVKV